MNLNNSIREAIVRSVIADIPRKHTKDLEERLQKIVDQDIAKNAPKPLATMWKDLGLRPYINDSHVHCGYLSTDKGYFYELERTFLHIPSSRHGNRYTLSAAGQKEYDETITVAREEAKSIKEAQSKLEGALAAMRTTKQFKAAFPELEKYAPKEDVKTGFPVAIANVVADLSALGWRKPKTKGPVAA